MSSNLVDLKELKALRLSFRIYNFLYYFKNNFFFVLMLNSLDSQDRVFLNQNKSRYGFNLKKISTKTILILFYLSKFNFLKNLFKGNLFFCFINEAFFLKKEFLNFLISWEKILIHFFYYKSNFYRTKSLENFSEKSLLEKNLSFSFLQIYSIYFFLFNLI